MPVAAATSMTATRSTRKMLPPRPAAALRSTERRIPAPPDAAAKVIAPLDELPAAGAVVGLVSDVVSGVVLGAVMSCSVAARSILACFVMPRFHCLARTNRARGIGKGYTISLVLERHGAAA